MTSAAAAAARASTIATAARVTAPSQAGAIARARSSVALFALMLLVTGCQEKAQSDLATVKMRLGQKTFTLEVADTPEARARGLMQRDSMPTDHGMIFVFEEARNLSFYMKNTRIPLDIIYIADTGSVISVKQMKPYDLSSTWSDGPAKWAVELNKGAAQVAGVKVGDVVEVPEGARKPR